MKNNRFYCAGHGDIVEILTEKMADINLRDNSGTTAIHYAALKGKRFFCVDSSEFL